MKIIREVYQIENFVLILNVKDITEQIKNLLCNLVNVMMYMNLMKTLLKIFNLEHLAIILLYKTQQKIYHCVLYQLQFKLKKKNL